MLPISRRSGRSRRPLVLAGALLGSLVASLSFLPDSAAQQSLLQQAGQFGTAAVKKLVGGQPSPQPNNQTANIVVPATTPTTSQPAPQPTPQPTHSEVSRRLAVGAADAGAGPRVGIGLAEPADRAALGVGPVDEVHVRAAGEADVALHGHRHEHDPERLRRVGREQVQVVREAAVLVAGGGAAAVSACCTPAAGATTGAMAARTCCG